MTLTIEHITVVEPVGEDRPVPARIHMMVTDGINLIKEPQTVTLNDWNIQFYDDEVISSYSSVHRYEQDSGLLGNRVGDDLIGAYMDTPVVEWLLNRGDLVGSHSESGEMVGWEGRFNSCNVLSQPFYPVTVFTPKTDVVSRELFMPVLYLNEVLECCELPWGLTLATIPAYCGDIVFELVDMR